MNYAMRRSDRLAALPKHARRLRGREATLGAHIEAPSPEKLIERNPRAKACRVNAVNMATACGLRTEGCGSAGRLAALAIFDCPEGAAVARVGMARDCDLPECAASMLDVAARILGLDTATRDSLICGVGSKRFRNLRATPKRAILDALGRAIAGAVGAGIWKPAAASPRDR